MISLSLPLQASNVPPTSSRPFSRVFARAPFPHLFLDPIPIRFLDHTSENTLREFTATWKQSSLRYWELRVYRYLSIKLECLVKLPEIDGHRTRKMRIKWQDIKDTVNGEAKNCSVYRSVFLFLLSIRRAVPKTKISQRRTRPSCSELGYPLSKRKTSSSFRFLRVPSNNNSHRSFRRHAKTLFRVLFIHGQLLGQRSFFVFVPSFLSSLSSFFVQSTRGTRVDRVYIYICPGRV